MAVLDTGQGLEVGERVTHLGNKTGGQCMGTVWGQRSKQGPGHKSPHVS